MAVRRVAVDGVEFQHVIGLLAFSYFFLFCFCYVFVIPYAARTDEVSMSRNTSALPFYRLLPEQVRVYSVK